MYEFAIQILKKELAFNERLLKGRYRLRKMIAERNKILEKAIKVLESYEKIDKQEGSAKEGDK